MFIRKRIMKTISWIYCFFFFSFLRSFIFILVLFVFPVSLRTDDAFYESFGTANQSYVQNRIYRNYTYLIKVGDASVEKL